MKLLVIGGSYFYGRVFVMLAAAEKHDITVVNRGTYSMEEFGVRQVRGDRRQGRTFAQCTGDYDVVIDFCAYNPGDAAFVLEHLPGQIKQYLLISTVDVYRRGTGAVKDEDFPLETRSFPGEAGAYILGKAALEEELCRECRRREIPFTILRPAILYGPYNYAPREYLFIRMAVQNRVLPGYTDAEGRFQLVYVKDAARAALLCLLEEKAYGQAFNLCQEEILDYDLFFQGIRQAADLELGRAVMTWQRRRRRNFPSPFLPRRRRQSLWITGRAERCWAWNIPHFRRELGKPGGLFEICFRKSKKINFLKESILYRQKVCYNPFSVFERGRRVWNPGSCRAAEEKERNTVS